MGFYKKVFIWDRASEHVASRQVCGHVLSCMRSSCLVHGRIHRDRRFTNLVCEQQRQRLACYPDLCAGRFYRLMFGLVFSIKGNIRLSAGSCSRCQRTGS